MRTTYREKSYICGDYKEVYIFPCFYEVTPGRRHRRPKAKPTEAAQKALNKKISENNLIRILNANFTEQDLSFDLTYTEENHPQTNEEANKDVQNFLRRLKAYRKRADLPDLKYVAVTAKGSKKGRYHHHLVINGGVDISKLAELWGLGYTKAAPLQFDELGLTRKGKYLHKQAIGYHSFRSSRNLIRPKAKTRDGRLSARRIERFCNNPGERRQFAGLFDGYNIAEADGFYNDVNGGFYLIVRLYRQDAAFQKSRKRRDK